jgi:serine/threonine protein kinase
MHLAPTGTPAFMAVELIEGALSPDNTNTHAGTKVDVFSFGVLLWVLWTQQMPYRKLKMSPFMLLVSIYRLLVY